MIDQKSTSIDSSGPAVDLACENSPSGSKLQLMNLKKQLALYLDNRGLTAAQLAKKAGVSKQVLSLWLAGGAPRKLEQVKAVADALGTTVDQLCFGAGVEKSAEESKGKFPDDEWMSGKFEIKVRRIK